MKATSFLPSACLHLTPIATVSFRQSIMATNYEALILRWPSKKDLLRDVPESITEFPLQHWDKGVFSLELLDQDITPVTVTSGKGGRKLQFPKGQVTRGTYVGTQMAITEMYNRIEAAYVNILSLPPCDTLSYSSLILSGVLEISVSSLKDQSHIYGTFFGLHRLTISPKENTTY